MAEARDGVDDHVDRWAAFWKDEPDFQPEIEGALVRMYTIQKRARRGDVAAFADSPDFTLEDYKTLHALMVQPYPTEAAQLAEVANVTRAAMTSRLDRLANAGLITREADSGDRRRVLIRPTAAGKAEWEKHIFEGMERDRQLLGTLSMSELRQLNGLLRKVLLAQE